jgi:diguanylate cyclase (GGDEF)-like protein
LGMERLLPTLHTQCQQIAPLDVFSVSLYDENTFQRQTVYFYDNGNFHQFPSADIRLNPGITGYVINTRKTLYLPDTLDPNNPSPVPPIRAGGLSSRTVLSVPLIVGEHVVGVISMQSYQPNAFSPQQIRLLEMFAVQAAIVVQNSQLYEQVQNLAITDELTGLLNRRALFEKGEHEIARAHRFNHPLAVIMIDIDHFKSVNDRLGHAMGDRVLRQIADSFRQNLRSTDTAARYGGEEFVILLPETHATLACQIAERLRASIEAIAMPVAAETIHVTVSLCLTTLAQATLNFSKLISRADQALYHSKNTGRNRATLWEGETR